MRATSETATTVTPERRAMLDGLAGRIVAARGDAPFLVGIQGRSAAGKSTFADELTKVLAARGVETFMSGLDDFHTPGHKHRSRRRLYTPETRYTEGYGYDAFRRCVIDPLMLGGDRRVRAALWNSGTDAPIDSPWIACSERVVAVDDVRRNYIEGWIPAHELYECATGAIDRCDIVIDQRDVERPKVVRTERHSSR